MPLLIRSRCPSAVLYCRGMYSHYDTNVDTARAGSEEEIQVSTLGLRSTACPIGISRLFHRAEYLHLAVSTLLVSTLNTAY